MDCPTVTATGAVGTPAMIQDFSRIVTSAAAGAAMLASSDPTWSVETCLRYDRLVRTACRDGFEQQGKQRQPLRRMTPAPRRRPGARVAAWLPARIEALSRETGRSRRIGQIGGIEASGVETRAGGSLLCRRLAVPRICGLVRTSSGQCHVEPARPLKRRTSTQTTFVVGPGRHLGPDLQTECRTLGSFCRLMETGGGSLDVDLAALPDSCR